MHENTYHKLQEKIIQYETMAEEAMDRDLLQWFGGAF